jgi:hypothetical protein
VTILNELLPEFDVQEVHELAVPAPPAAVYVAARDVTVGEIRLLAPLMLLRMLPARLHRRPLAIDRRSRAIDAFLAAGFVLLGERSHEIALGAIGRFWSISGNAPIPDIETPERFAVFEEQGYAKAALELRVLPDPRGARIVTETRVWSTSPGARRSFGRYWLLIRWPSGAIRRSWLHAIRERAQD